MRSTNADTPASILRIILTPECNLQCIYCHNEGFKRKGNRFPDFSLPEFKQIITTLQKNGVNSVCLTGGDPLVSGVFPDVLKTVTDVFGGNQTHVSTNGILLDSHLDLMHNLGVSRINISCDAIDRNLYKQITGKNCFETVIKNIEKATRYSFFINVNCVTLKGLNTDRDYICAMLDFWRKMGVRLSFLRLCFSHNGMDDYKYDMNDLIEIFNSMGLESYTTPHSNRPPTVCYPYHDMEVALRYYVPDRSNYPCTACEKREVCSEGLYHPRLGLNGIVRACILREDLSLDLGPNASATDNLAEFLKIFDSIPETWIPADCCSP